MTELNMSEVKNFTYSKLENFLKPHGFSYIKSKGQFRRKFKGGYHGIVVIFTNYKPQYQIDFYLSIRLDAINDIVNPFRSMNPEVVKDNFTIATSYGHFTGNRFNRFEELYTIEDLDRVTTEIEDFMEKVGLSYFEKYTDLNSIYTALNSNKVKLTADEVEHCLIRLSSAKLLKINEIDELASEHEQELKKLKFTNGFYPDRFNKFVDFLKQNEK